MRYHLPFLSLAAAALKSYIISLHQARFHRSSCLHSSTSVCDDFRPVVAGSNSAWSLTAVSFLTEQASHFCPNVIWSIRVITDSSPVAKSKLDSLCSWYLCIFRLDKMSLKNLYIYIYIFLNIATKFSFCCWALKCNSSKSEFKTIKNL